MVTGSGGASVRAAELSLHCSIRCAAAQGVDSGKPPTRCSEVTHRAHLNLTVAHDARLICHKALLVLHEGCSGSLIKHVRSYVTAF